MSQLFDSLRRGRRNPVPAAARGGGYMNNGEAILASLGYKPIRRTNPLAVSAVAILALAGAGYYAWHAWPKPAQTAGQARTPQVRDTPSTATKPPVGAPRAQSPAPPATAAPSGASDAPPKNAPPPASTVSKGESNAAAMKTPESASGPRRDQKALSTGVALAPAPPMPAVDTRAPRTRPQARATAPATPDQGASESEEFSLAVYHQRAGDFENALLQYRAVLAKNELNAQARNNLGLLYLDKGLLDDAARELRRALIIDSRYAKARVNLGVALMRQQRKDDAAAEFRAALAQDPRNVDALINLALVETDAAPERAKELLIRALGIAPRHALAHYNLAVVFDHSGEVARAVEHYRSFLDYAGPDVSARAPDVRARIDALTRR